MAMTQINFPKLMTRDKKVSSLVAALLAAIPGMMGVEDAAGTLLMGGVERSREEYPLPLDGEVIGWVVGDEGAAVVAKVLTYIVGREAEMRSLARDALDKYRELNLLYELSEKIGASLDVRTVATIAVNETRRRIKEGTGFVLALDEVSATLEAIGSPEIPPFLTGGIAMGQGIIGHVASSGRAEVVVDVGTDPRRSAHERTLRSLVCAPLKARQRVIGVLAIGSQEPIAYTAADVKFMSTIASQAAPAIDNALLYERTVSEARERERQLQQQIAELRIEVDQARQSQQVAAITGTEYFKALREQANDLRKVLESSA